MVIKQYIGWVGWILQHTVSLQHCFDLLTKTIETLSQECFVKYPTRDSHY